MMPVIEKLHLRPACQTSLQMGRTIVVVMLALGLCGCFSGIEPTESDEELFSRVLELASQGNATAQYNVGMFYNNGIGVTKDPQKAFEWFGKATAAGDPLGAFKLGCYYGGQFPGVVAVDYGRSLEYKLIAAEAGYLLAQLEVGGHYYQTGAFEEALKWWAPAAAQGNPNALYYLSVFYREGKGVEKNLTLAYVNFMLAVRVAGDDMPPELRASLDELAASLSEEEKAEADKMVSAWKPEPTPLTLRAFDGIGEARRLVNDAR